MNWIRGIVVLTLAWVAAWGAGVVVNYLGRAYLHLEPLLRTEFILAIAIATAIASGALAFRLLPRLRTKWWAAASVVVALGVIPVALLLALDAHDLYGTPASDCRWSGMQVERCVGRDWSLLQDRQSHLTVEGRMDSAACKAFVQGVSTQPQDAHDTDGWVRCPSESPAAWIRADCEEVALNGMAQCFSCGGVSDTSDTYQYSVGFDAPCARGKVRFGVNVPLRRIDECAKSVHETDCRTPQILPNYAVH